MKGASFAPGSRFGLFRGQSVFPWYFAVRGYELHYNKCMDVNKVLQNALTWLHNCYMEFMPGRKLEHAFFRVK